MFAFLVPALLETILAGKMTHLSNIDNIHDCFTNISFLEKNGCDNDATATIHNLYIVYVRN